MSSNKSNIKSTNWVLSSLFLALALVLPFLTGQFQELGNKLLPMHIPVLLCGFICGPIFGAIVGFISPLLRFALFGMPTIFPIGISMCFELATYGLVSGILYSKHKDKKGIYLTLIISMLFGRVVWGITQFIIYGFDNVNFGLDIFVSAAFIQAIPGIVIQIIIIPIIIMTLQKSKL